MHAEDKALGVIFETTVRHFVPLFQRPYVWKRENNWKPLWDAIKTVADRRLMGTDVRPYFLGAIVLEQLKTNTGEVNIRQVIDGQQRLTTLQIVIAAIRDICAVKGLDQYHEAFNRLTENFDPSGNNSESKFKVWPTNVDRNHFRNTMDAGSLKFLEEKYGLKIGSKDFGHLLPNCYYFFYSEALSWLREEGDKSFELKLKALYDTVLYDLVLVVVDLGDGDDPQLIFETLNALGTPLQPADLVKNFLFHRAERQGAKISDLYEQVWKPFDDDINYWRKEIRQGRLMRHRIDLFLAHYLTLLRKDGVNMTYLFGEFRDYFDNGNNLSAENHIRQLRNYADVYQSFDKYPANSREGLFFSRLEALDTSMAIPVLLEKLRDPKASDDRNQFLDYLESYLVRRAVCCFTYKNYNRIFVDMIRYLSERSFSSAELRSFLLSRKGESSEWPSDEAFRKAFCEYRIYKRLKQSRTRMVLEAIELFMHDDKSESILIQEKLTIEHIMPQEWHYNWPLEDGSTLEDEIERNEIIHRFGNLTLVNNKLNPSLSNAPWNEKKEAIEKHSLLTLNKKLQNIDEWTEKSIKERGAKLFEKAVKIWPRPTE